jgi:hypothetical protein
MKRSAVVTLALLALASPTFAEPKDAATNAANSADQYYVPTEKGDFHASKLIGSRVYATEATVDADAAVENVNKEWDDIGEVNNIVVGRDGTVKAVVVGVGGFLGLGEKNIAVKMDELKFLKKAGDDASDYFIVVKSNKESLEKAPEYKAVAE